MEGLSTAASVIAVVDMSAKVASLLFQYSKEVKNAKEDIAQVQLKVLGLKSASESVQQLLSGPNKEKLEASQKLLAALHDSLSQLRKLEQELDPGKTRKVMRRVGLRALRWPFDSKGIEKTVQDLGACIQAISLGLQVDQMYAAALPLSLRPARLTWL
jgi:hypothetical protein